MADAFGRLLIVDDEEPVLDVLAEYFTSQGHRVETAASGLAALDALDRTRPDLVLLDIRMAGMDGVQVLREIRVRASTVPVVMITANEDVALARLTLKLGAFDYVSKPFDFAYLDRAVTAALLQSAMATEGAKDADRAGDPWTSLVLTIFRATRGMAAPARAVTGERMESAALAAAGEGAAGAVAAARRALDDVGRLAWVAGELGDLGDGERRSIEAAVSAARSALAKD
ncbi:MAG: response regulator [Candidatus Rokubacteria bacterium]|nr:response regulator [Candidatus Rokubacteria bacterium]